MASRSIAEMTLPGEQDLWFLPLGGCGEIGMNLNLYGHAGRWLMVDCGVTFYNPLQPQTQPAQLTAEVQAADPSFIAAQRENLCGIVITHAHEDHIGAVPYFAQELGVPLYATPFTARTMSPGRSSSPRSGPTAKSRSPRLICGSMDPLMTTDSAAFSPAECATARSNSSRYLATPQP